MEGSMSKAFDHLVPSDKVTAALDEPTAEATVLH